MKRRWKEKNKSWLSQLCLCSFVLFRPDPNTSPTWGGACEGWACLVVINSFSQQGKRDFACLFLSIWVWAHHRAAVVSWQHLTGCWREWQSMDTGMFVNEKSCSSWCKANHSYMASIPPLCLCWPGTSHAAAHPAAKTNSWRAGCKETREMKWEEDALRIP